MGTLRLSIIAQYHPEMSSVKPLVLHAHGTGPNPYKVACVLESLGVPYEVKLWQFGDAPNGGKGEQFLKINQNGRVPALEDPNNGVVSWESGAVMNYILRVYDKQNKLGPRGNDEQAIVDFEKWSFFLVSTLGPFKGQLKHGGQWILPGDGPSAVDFHFYPWVYQHGFAGLSLDQYPTVAKWVKNVNELKEVKSAYEKVAKGQQM